MKQVRQWKWIMVAGCAFALGYAVAQSSAERAVSQAQSDLDANAAALNKQWAAINEELKRVVAGTNIELNQAEQLQKDIESKATAAVAGLETSLVRAMVAILEKTVHANGIEGEAYGRLSEFFGAEPSYLAALKGKGVTIGSMVTGLGIAKAKNLKPETVFEAYLAKKSWADIATAHKLQPTELMKALNGLVPRD